MASREPEHLVQRDRLRPQASYCYLLDADADLAQEFDLRMRVVARQAATVVVFEIPIGEHAPSEWLAAGMGGLGLLLLDGIVAVEVQVGDRTATELTGAGDLLQAPAATGDDLLEHAETWHVLVPARVAVLDAAFAERVRPWPQIALALLRRAGKRAEDLDVQRAIACQPRLEVRLALVLWHLAARWGKVELGGIRLSLPLTHRLLGQLVGRRAPVGLPRPGAPGRGRARHRPRRRVAPARLARAPPRVLRRARAPRVTPDRRGGARSGPCVMLQTEFTPGQRRSERQLVNVVWMTSGLGCDGDTVSLTAATSPSLEELLTGAIPGTPAIVIYNPVLAFENGDELMRAWYDAERGRLDPFVLVLEGSVPNEEINGEGHWAGFGVDPESGQPITTCSWIDRLAPKAAAVMAIGTCAAYGGVPAMRNNPTGAMGLRDYLGWNWASRLGIPIVNLPGCPVQPNNITETLLALVAAARRAGADDRPRRPGPAAVAVRPDRPRDVQPRGLRRGGQRSPTRWATTSAAWSSSGARGPWSSATCPHAAGSTGSAAAPTSAASASGAPRPGSPIASCRSRTPTASGWRPRALRASPTAPC